MWAVCRSFFARLLGFTPRTPEASVETPSRVFRTIVYVDGFNLFHAIDDLGADHLKWIDLESLCKQFIGPDDEIVKITYCSAYATYRPEAYRKHQHFVEAQPDIVVPVMGKFRERRRRCGECGQKYDCHEEKETDVNIAVQMLLDAHKGQHECTYLLTADSDMVPAVRALRESFPDIRIRLIYPIRRGTSGLLDAAGLERPKRMKRAHLERAMMSAEVAKANGRVVTRPAKYDPPQ